MSTEFAVEASGLGKAYRVAAIGSGDSRRDRFSGLWHRTFRGDIHRTEDFWAVRGVDLEVRRGEIVGIIGRNGSGKTTLLRLLARVTSPTEGRAVIHGRVAALLGIGASFNANLTGRENISLSGALAGMSPQEVAKRFDAIVEFADLGRYLDEPVRRYSSGMQSRLPFAIAAHLPAEVMLVDEALSVGDAVFSQKATELMRTQLRDGRSVLFVSHSPSAVRDLCDRGIVLHEGRVRFSGSADDAARYYETEIVRKATPRPEPINESEFHEHSLVP